MTDSLREKIAAEITLSAEPGKTIRKWREVFGISQNSLADSLGVSHSVVSDYESGRRKSPGTAMVRNIVDTFIQIDVANGSPVSKKYVPEEKLDCIISSGEFSEGIEMEKFIGLISGKNLISEKQPHRIVWGYTIIDSLKAITSLSSGDYTKIYGWSTERALIFTNVHYGRSPMVAVRAHPLTPALVVYVKPDNTDPLAIKLAKLEKIPLVTTELGVEEITESLGKFKE